MQATLKKTLRSVLLLLSIGVVMIPATFGASSTQAQERRDHGYAAHLAELMNESMQVHHTKLWLAGHANNWALAAYEVRKLQATVEEVKEAIVEIQSSSAKWQKVPVGEMLRSVDSHLHALGQAVKAKNAAQFETAYRGLTGACNACHSRAGESQVKIIVPTANGGAFIDQEFTAGGQ